MNAVDLFAGCGGLSLGFVQAGFRVGTAVEFDPAIAGTYQKNHPGVRMLVEDIRKIDAAKSFSPGEAEVIIGGPPCQGVSMAGARIRRGFTDDPRNYLFRHYLDIAARIRPKVFVMENVKGLQTMQNGRIFREILAAARETRLHGGSPCRVFSRVVRAVDFGLPQKRERLILIGTVLPDLPFERLWEETRAEIAQKDPDWFLPATVRDAIGNLPPVTASGIVARPEPQTAYQRSLAGSSPELRNHTRSRHSPKAVERMRQIGGGRNYTELEEEIRSVHSGSYGRLCWDEPAATITTRFDTPAGGRFIHPEEDRTLTPREAARLQSFPDDFVFYGTRREISRQIGNAVPPRIAYFLARLTKKILEQQKG